MLNHQTDNTPTWNTLWAMEKTALLNTYVASQKPQAQGQNQQPQKPLAYSVEGTVAIVPIVGPVVKYPSLMQMVFGGVSTLAVQDALDKALNDEKIERIVLYIDSPGGTAAGTTDLAEFISVAKTLKPITAYVSDHCFSSAYWIASQCTTIIANEAGFVGAIGCYVVLADTSQAHENAGLNIHLVSSGGVKGKDVDGLPIDAELITEVQRQVDAVTDLFKNSVSKGRNIKIDEVTQLADGRIHVASEALARGLIDGIGPLNSAIQGTFNMPNIQPKAETKAEVKAEAEESEAQSLADAIKQIQNDLAELKDKVGAMSKDDEDGDEDGDEKKKDGEGDDDADTEDGDMDAAKCAVAAEQTRLKDIQSAVGNRSDFAVKCFLEGKSVIEAKAALADLLTNENAALQKKVAKSNSGIEPLALGGPVPNNTNDPETIWEQNIGDVQTMFRGKKKQFLKLAEYQAKKQVTIRGSKNV